MKPKIPKGWKRLKRGEKIMAEDKCSEPYKNYFNFTGFGNGEVRVGWDADGSGPLLVYIRRIKPKKKGPKK